MSNQFEVNGWTLDEITEIEKNNNRLAIAAHSSNGTCEVQNICTTGYLRNGEGASPNLYAPNGAYLASLPVEVFSQRCRCNITKELFFKHCDQLRGYFKSNDDFLLKGWEYSFKKDTYFVTTEKTLQLSAQKESKDCTIAINSIEKINDRYAFAEVMVNGNKDTTITVLTKDMLGPLIKAVDKLLPVITEIDKDGNVTLCTFQIDKELKLSRVEKKGALINNTLRIGNNTASVYVNEVAQKISVSELWLQKNEKMLKEASVKVEHEPSVLRISVMDNLNLDNGDVSFEAALQDETTKKFEFAKNQENPQVKLLISEDLLKEKLKTYGEKRTPPNTHQPAPHRQNGGFMRGLVVASVFWCCALLMFRYYSA